MRQRTTQQSAPRRSAARKAVRSQAAPLAPRKHPRGFDLELARKALMRADPDLARWIKSIGPLDIHWRRRFDPVDALARAILYQQLSGKAAATIVGRVEKILPGGPKFQAPDLATVSIEALRACGVSQNKALALKDLAAKSLQGVVPQARELDYLDNETLVARLTSVRGIGRWTVEMMLMFRLGRPDVLPIDDLGIRKGAQRVWGLKEMPKPKELAGMAQHWAPHRTLASLYLWRCTDAPQPKAAVKRSQA